MLTVLFASHNGKTTLATTLDRFHELDPPTGGWKLIAVDNNSTDGSAEIIHAYTEQLPLTYKFESRQGKNFALNSALDEIEGDLVVFTDDDVYPDGNWLTALRAAADEHLDFDIFAGKIVPRWPAACPEWIKSLPYQTMASAYGATWPHLERGPISHGLAFGANVAIRRRYFDEGFRFDTGIGPSGGNYVKGSETEFHGRLAEAGARTWYCPEAQVGHIIEKEQTSEAWLMGRARRQGRGNCRLNPAHGKGSGVFWLGAPRWLWRKAATSYLAGLAARIRGDHTTAITKLYEANIHHGYIQESRRRPSRSDG